MKKADILRRQSDFTAVYNKGKSSVSRYVVIIYRKNGTKESRFAFVASKKTGNAVERNRARRLMKESCRQLGPVFRAGYDMIFVARSGIAAKETKCADVKKSIEAAARRAGLLKSE